jgi:hypothetical protein
MKYKLLIFEILGSHGEEYECGNIVGYSAVQCRRSTPTFLNSIIRAMNNRPDDGSSTHI